MRDGERSRMRVLAAATVEFAAFGIAGARVDRIAAASGVNKAQMYGWYRSKDGLFDAVFAEQLHRIVDTVPFRPGDLPGYAVALYDSYLAAPELVRLAGWCRLERVSAGDLLRGHPELVAPKYEAVTRAQAEGRIVADLRPEEVYALVIALAGTWSPISATFAAAAADDGADHDRRRQALRAVVARALVPRPRD